jgi:DNA-directed RNA polymerase subunit K/omega
MATTLATVRTALFDELSEIADAQTYRTRQRNYQYPAIVVGWPQTMNVGPSMGEARDFVIDIGIAVEVTDDESSDDTLSGILEEAVDALSSTSTWMVQPATDFGEELINDNRTVIWCRLPVAVFE